MHSSNYAAIQTAINTGLVPVPASIATGEAAVYDGANWVRSSVTKLNFASLTDPGTGKVIGSASSAAAAVYPPGYEIAYVEFTSDVTSSVVAEASASDVASSGSITFDGTAVWVEFFSPRVITGNGGQTILTLWNDSTDLGRIGQLQNTTGISSGALIVKRKITPTAAAHTIKIKTFAGSVAGTVSGAAGGTGVNMPGFIRITKA